MMSWSHAESGVLAATVTAYATSAPPAVGVLMLATLPGFAVLPDIDHPDSNVTHALGPLGRLPSMLFEHRRETHSVPGILLFMLATEVAVRYQGSIVANVWLTFILVTGWLSVFKILKWGGWARLLPVAAAVGIVWYPRELHTSGISFSLDALPVLVGAGMFVHVVGDMLTFGGCPLFWPLSKRRFMLNWFKTNGPGEQLARVVIWLGIAASGGGWVWGLASQASPMIK